MILSAKQLIKESSSHEDTSADAFGRSVSCQLKELPKLQRCIVEKMIGELLFYAKLGELSLDASIKLNKNMHTGTQPYYTPPYRSHLYQQLSSPSPQYSQTSQSPKYMQLSQSPQYLQPSPSPQYLQPSPSPQYSQTSQSPKYTQPSPSPKHSQQSQLPKRTQQSPSPIHSHHSPSPKYTEPSPSPRNSRHSSLTKHTQPIRSPQHSSSSSPHYLQHDESLSQQSTSSVPQTPADSITIYSADPQAQYLPYSQVLSPTDTLSELTPSEATQFNMTQTVFRGQGEELQDFLIFKK